MGTGLGAKHGILIRSGEILEVTHSVDTVVLDKTGTVTKGEPAVTEVCPAGAILKITPAEKSAIQVGRAVWVRDNCVPLTDGVACGNCARHCPTGAITMVPSDPERADSPKIPAINEERCIGCGACENLCPARPFSAIYVEGYTYHRTI